MNLAAIAIKYRPLTYLTVVLLVVGGLLSYTQLGQLEDPNFSIKSVTIITPYPGATAQEVELEVTDRIEQRIQELSEVDFVKSLSRAGQSVITVEFKGEYWSDRLPQVFDHLRRKITDVQPQLPPGAGVPMVNDSFGDVYGLLLAVVGDGFTYAQLQDYVDIIRKELSLVDGVARVEKWGERAEAIYLDISRAKIAELGVTLGDIQTTLQQQNLVVDAGGFDVQDKRLRANISGAFQSPEDIGDLYIRGLQQQFTGGQSLTRIRDIAKVRRGYVEPDRTLLRYNSQPAIALSLSNVAGANVVDMGIAVDKRLAELLADLPVGIEANRVAWQSDVVQKSISDFVISLAEALAIVLIVLWFAMGFRMAMIVGVCGLLLSILATFIYMHMEGINLQRMSLGALIIAMGMMVDNAIVVADGMMVRLQRGMDREKAAIESATQPAWPLLGATVIAVLAFYPIGGSTDSTGEYCGSLYKVVAVSLLISWVLSVTVTPVLCMVLLKAPKNTGAADADNAYNGPFFRGFRGLLAAAIRLRLLFVAAMVGLLVIAAIGFGKVDKTFFPDASRSQFMIDYWLPEGARIDQAADDLAIIGRHVMNQQGVDAVATFIGAGPPRFYLPVEPEKPNSGYGQLIVNTASPDDVDRLVPILRNWLTDHAPQAQTSVRKFAVGPGETWKIQARFSGPAEADPNVLRHLGDQALAILRDASPQSVCRTNWRNRQLELELDYAQVRARRAGVDRSDIASTTQRLNDGLPVGSYREGDTILPILLRQHDNERATSVSSLPGASVLRAFNPVAIPLGQVTNEINPIWKDPIIWRYNRRRALTVEAYPVGISATALQMAVMDQINAIKLPPGYELEWDGEFASSQEAQAGLIPGVVPAFIVMLIIVVALFNGFRDPIIIGLTIPFVAIGVTAGLLATGQPFGFMALLGAMSLAGMMIKNAIVLLDEIRLERAAGNEPYDAILKAAVSRLRPVLLAAGTTVLGVIPLLQDVFWISMAITIMAGLAFGTLLTMFLVPVLYSMLYQIESK